MQYIDEQELRRGVAALHPDGEIFEIRIISNDGKTNFSGYFRDSDTLLGELKKIDMAGMSVYTTINGVNEACYDRIQQNRLVKNTKTTTGDRDIISYSYLFVDLDPKRPAGISSSDAELDKARKLGNEIFVFMRNLGFYAPLSAYSGNGVHLLYRVSIDNTEENVKLMQRCLEALNVLFSNDDVEVDVKNYNPSRICKLYGTVAQKGRSTKDRPHRMSRITGPKDAVEVNDMAYLKKLADMIPTEPERPQRYNNYSPRDFDLESWMNAHGLNYRKTTCLGGKKYILDHCPFDSNHNGKDACIFQRDNGAIGFHCFHNSCSGKGWKDVRLLLEPDAYEKRDRYQEGKIYRDYNRDRVSPPAHIQEKNGLPVFFTAMDIYNMPQKEESFIKTGTTTLDQKLRGLKKGGVSLLSGLRGAAKSTVLSQWALQAINDGFNVGVYSGELSERNFMRWMYQQAAGKGRVEASLKWEGYYTVPPSIQEKIAKWMGDRFFLYNNAYGNDFEAVAEQFVKKIQSDKLDMLILDNLMAFNINALADSKWEAQTQFVWQLHEIAQRFNVHILFVAHPRKAMGFLRLDDISGSADLANAVDSAFIIHRNNNDFNRLTKAMFQWKDDHEAYKGTNVIEIAKDRDGGTQDVFVPLWYERESKRLKNDLSENIIYGWDGGASDLDWISVPEVPAEELPEIPFD